MPIKVLYFASLREEIGRSSDEIDLSQLQVTSLTVEQLWEQATGESILPETLLVSVNQEYRDSQYLLNEGDEVAFFPPVTGG